jgi:hypothetical protein
MPHAEDVEEVEEEVVEVEEEGEGGCSQQEGDDGGAAGGTTAPAAASAWLGPGRLRRQVPFSNSLTLASRLWGSRRVARALSRLDRRLRDQPTKLND